MRGVSLSNDIYLFANPATEWITQDWVKALIPIVAAIIATIGAIWNFRRGGVKWKIRARIDKQRQGIQLKIGNKGRSAGEVHSVLLLERDGSQYTKVEYAGFPDEAFKPFTVSGHSQVILVLNAERGAPIPKSLKLQVHAGGSKARIVRIATAPSGQSIYKTAPMLPPGGIT